MCTNAKRASAGWFRPRVLCIGRLAHWLASRAACALSRSRMLHAACLSSVCGLCRFCRHRRATEVLTASVVWRTCAEVQRSRACRPVLHTQLLVLHPRWEPAHGFHILCIAGTATGLHAQGFHMLSMCACMPAWKLAAAVPGRCLGPGRLCGRASGKQRRRRRRLLSTLASLL